MEHERHAISIGEIADRHRRPAGGVGPVSHGRLPAVILWAWQAARRYCSQGEERQVLFSDRDLLRLERGVHITSLVDLLLQPALVSHPEMQSRRMACCNVTLSSRGSSLIA